MIFRYGSIKLGHTITRIHTLRLLQTTVAVTASHHDDIPPVHVPKPAVGERNLLGSIKTPSSKFQQEPYKPRKDDWYSFAGAGVGILLTVLAVTFYTELFGMNVLKKDHGAKAHSHGKQREVPHKEEEEVQKTELSELTKNEGKVEAHSEEEYSEVAASQPSTVGQTQEEDKGVEHVQSVELADESVKKEHTKHASEVVAASTSDSDVANEVPTFSQSDVEEKKTQVSSTGVEVPKFVEYLLVGAGTAAYYASLAIRARHADAKVLMIGEEPHLPYNRPPLSKELWWYGDDSSSKNLQYEGLNGKKRDVFFEAEGFFVPPAELPQAAHGGVSLLKGHQVKRLSPDEKKVYLDDGTCIAYDKCLIATGGRPKVLPALDEAPEDAKERILYLRGVDDYRKLDSVCKSSNSVAVVGGGFLGSELAYSIRRRYKDVEVTQIVAEEGNLNGVLPQFLSTKASEALRAFGVDVRTNSKVASVRNLGNKLQVEVEQSKPVICDCIVVAVGIEPNTSVAEASGLEIDNRIGGVLTDAELRVRSDIWAAGDAASFYDKSLGRRRIEHWENAQVSGRLAGENMTGAGKAYWYQPAFFTKIAPHWNINAVGMTDASLPTVSVFAKDENVSDDLERGVIFYKDEHEKVVGVLLINVYGSAVDVSRRLIEERRSVEDFRQLAKLYPLYKPDEPEEEKKAEKSE